MKGTLIYLNKYKSDKRSKNLLFYISIATYVIAFFITVERVHEFIKIMDMQGIVDYILYIINHALNFYA